MLWKILFCHLSNYQPSPHFKKCTTDNDAKGILPQHDFWIPSWVSLEHGKILNIEKWFLNLMETIRKSGKENAMQETQVQSLGQEESL